MAGSYDDLLNRIRDRRIADARQLREERRAAAPIVDASAGPLPIGTRVFDRETGLEGWVIDGRTENIIVPAAE